MLGASRMEADVAEQPYDTRKARLRLAAVYLLVAVMVALSFISMRPTPLQVTVGFLIALAGEAVRFWAAGHLVKTTELITSGPYRYTRNPLYLGRLLIFTGLCVMASLPYGANWVVLGIGWAVFFGYYLPRKERVEPARLREKHGDAFERYYRAVPALLPTFRPYPEGASAGWSSDRMLRNREHYMVVGILLISLFLLWRSYRPQEPVVAPSPSAPAARTAPTGTP